MKKGYVKPCSTCVIVAAEQAMLAGSEKGLRVTNENFERAPHTTIGSSTPAKENPFEYDEE
ncbi:MAG: hypothetical protein HXO45_09380 [Prevotella sp.]|nr:hypothetical protein [Prevotella sp.]